MESGHLFLFAVFADLFCITASLFDAALQKPCSQSSTHDRRVAGKAVNRIIHNELECTHTGGNDNSPWWQVDLGETYSVHSVFLRNMPTAGQRLSNFTITVSSDGVAQGSLCAFHRGAMADKEAKLLLCDKIKSGRFVMISKNTTVLALCEVQVLVMDRSSLCTVQGRVCKQLHQRVVLIY